METKFSSSYSSTKRKIQENDIFQFPLNDTKLYYSDRQNNYLYNIDKENIHHVNFFERNKSIKLFYLNKYKTIKEDTIKYIPFDTEHCITQEICGKSVFVSKVDNKRYFFTRYKEKNDELVELLRSKIEYKYIIDKYSKLYTLEFKLYNNVVYLVNAFNSNKILHYNEIYKIANQFDIRTPKEVNNLILKQGIRTLDTFYNDYYLSTDNFIHDKNYFITIFFKNNKFLLYKLAK